MAHLHGQVLRIIIVLIIINPQVQVKNLDLSIIILIITAMYLVAVIAMAQMQEIRMVRTSRHLGTNQMIENWRNMKNINQNNQDRIFKNLLVLTIQMMIHNHLRRDKPLHQISILNRKGRKYVDHGLELLKNKN